LLAGIEKESFKIMEEDEGKERKEEV